MTLARGDRIDKVAVEHPSRIVADWIEEMQRAGNADALRWMIGRAAFAFLALYPEDRGPQVLWGIFRGLAGGEPGELLE